MHHAPNRHTALRPQNIDTQLQFPLSTCLQTLNFTKCFYKRLYNKKKNIDHSFHIHIPGQIRESFTSFHHFHRLSLPIYAILIFIIQFIYCFNSPNNVQTPTTHKGCAIPKALARPQPASASPLQHPGRTARLRWAPFDWHSIRQPRRNRIGRKSGRFWCIFTN